MININLWSNKIRKNMSNNRKIIQLLNESFQSKKDLINNKTYVISIINKESIIGTVSLIENKDLINHLKFKMSENDYNESYIFRACKGYYIYNLSVAKEYRGNGVAQKLVDIAMYIIKIKKGSYCHVSCENNISEHIFKKKGFKIEKNFKNKKGENITLLSSWI